MGILGQLLLQRAQANSERQNAINTAQAQGLINSMSAVNPDGTPALDEAHLQAAHEQLEKLIGTKGSGPIAADSKNIFQRFGQIVSAIHGHTRQQAGGQPAPGGATTAGNIPGMPPPLVSSPQAAPTPAPLMTAPTGSGAVPSMPGAASPPTAPATEAPAAPPAKPITFADTMQASGRTKSMPLIAAENLREQMISLDTRAKAAGLEPGTPQYQYFMQSSTPLPISTQMFGAKLFDRNTNEPFIGRGLGPNGGYLDDTGTEHMNVRAGYASDASNVKKLQSPPGGGAPIGVQIGNNSWAAGDPNMPAEAKDYLAKGVKEYNSHQQDLTERGISTARARAEYQAKFRVTPVTDSDGNATLASAWDIIQHPDKYPANFNEGDTIMLRKGMYNEMHQAIGQMQNAVANMPEDGFDAKQRAQLILAMKSIDPKSAVQSWIKSEAAGSLSQAQQDYAQAVASLQESMMVLRSAGKMGQATDKVRDAIGGMTPDLPISKDYIAGQIDKLNKQINTLESAQPGLKGLAPRVPANVPAMPPGGNGSSKPRTIVIH